jgi:hypothetical protein
MKLLNTGFALLLGTFVVIVIYGVLNWVLFLNVIEAPLPEHEEKIPDLNLTKE